MAEKQWLRAGVQGKAEAVDKTAKIIRGAVAAQLGPFKDNRGEFDRRSLKKVIELGNDSAGGLKSRLGHATLSDDGVSRYLGRFKNFRESSAFSSVLGENVPAVRADLYLAESARKTPSGDLVEYVLGLSEEDAGALSASLVLQVDEEEQRDVKGRLATDKDGEPKPTIWIPKVLHGLDVVSEGAAVDDFLAASLAASLKTGQIDPILLRFDNIQKLMSGLIDGMFPGAGRDELRTRLTGFIEKCLLERYGEEAVIETPRIDARLERLKKFDELVKKA